MLQTMLRPTAQTAAPARRFGAPRLPAQPGQDHHASAQAPRYVLGVLLLIVGGILAIAYTIVLASADASLWNSWLHATKASP